MYILKENIFALFGDIEPKVTWTRFYFVAAFALLPVLLKKSAERVNHCHQAPCHSSLCGYCEA